MQNIRREAIFRTRTDISGTGGFVSAGATETLPRACVRCWLEKNLRFEIKAAIIATEENRRLRGAFPARLHLCFSEMIVKRPPVKKRKAVFSNG
ncbi:MAG: hypothetical protein LIO54_00220 [Oscillospiraceae bacterium]|nr:hypothetical protein [Oscillospiraceae bacterium]